MNHKKAIKNYDEGCLFIEQGKLSSAEKCFKKAVKLNPNYIEAYNNLGNVLQIQGKKHKIVVLEHGRIIDMGPHKQLLESCPLYKRLYNMQFSIEN